MHCIDFRRAMTIDPMCRDPELSGHEDACTACASFARALRADEIALRAILRQAEPPEGMAERIQHAAKIHHRARPRHWRIAALACLLAVLTGSAIELALPEPDGAAAALARSVLNHIQDETHVLRFAGVVPSGRIKMVFRRFGAEVAASIGPVYFVAECPMHGASGIHLVMPGEAGPVTILLMPGEHRGETIALRDHRFDGSIVPTAWGSLAVVGEQGEPIATWQSRIQDAVRWPVAGLGNPQSSNLAGHRAGPEGRG